MTYETEWSWFTCELRAALLNRTHCCDQRNDRMHKTISAVQNIEYKIWNNCTKDQTDIMLYVHSEFTGSKQCKLTGYLHSGALQFFQIWNVVLYCQWNSARHPMKASFSNVFWDSWSIYFPGEATYLEFQLTDLAHEAVNTQKYGSNYHIMANVSALLGRRWEQLVLEWFYFPMNC